MGKIFFHVRLFLAMIGDYNVQIYHSYSGAMRTYFKTLKNRAQREKTNKQEDMRIKQRRRQQKINVWVLHYNSYSLVTTTIFYWLQKALAHKKALKNTTSLSADVKAQLELLLTAAYMSSDESVISSDSASKDEIENTSLPPPTKRKKLIKHHANWRSAEFQDYIESLDRKIESKLTEGRWWCCRLSM